MTAERVAQLRSAKVAIAIVTAAASALAIVGGSIEEAALRFGFIPARVSGMALDVRCRCG